MIICTFLRLSFSIFFQNYCGSCAAEYSLTPRDSMCVCVCRCTAILHAFQIARFDFAYRLGCPIPSPTCHIRTLICAKRNASTRNHCLHVAFPPWDICIKFQWALFFDAIRKHLFILIRLALCDFLTLLLYEYVRICAGFFVRLPFDIYSPTRAKLMCMCVCLCVCRGSFGLCLGFHLIRGVCDIIKLNTFTFFQLPRIHIAVGRLAGWCAYAHTIHSQSEWNFLFQLILRPSKRNWIGPTLDFSRMQFD